MRSVGRSGNPITSDDEHGDGAPVERAAGASAGDGTGTVDLGGSLRREPVLPFARAQDGGGERTPGVVSARQPNLGGLPFLDAAEAVMVPAMRPPGAQVITSSPWSGTVASTPDPAETVCIGSLRVPAQNAALKGAAAASDAAAQSGNVAGASVPVKSTSQAGARPASGAADRDIVDLLWLDSDVWFQVRRHSDWRKILTDIKPKTADRGSDDDVPPEKRQELRERRDALGILTRGSFDDAAGLQQALRQAVTGDGGFVPPLVLVEGMLEFPFHELETLKATIAAVTPSVAGDKTLKETVDAVKEVLREPLLQNASSVIEGLTARVKDVFARGHKALPPHYLESHTERMLLQARCYQTRQLMKRRWIRSLFAFPGELPLMPSYLPEIAAEELPMFARLRVRMIAEAHAQLDQYEMHPHALRIIALGRVLPAMGKG